MKKILRSYKKIKLLALVFCLYTISSKAQTVTIPDANFVAYLHSVIPSAMNGNLMDTTNITVTTKDTIIVAKRNITNLSGIQYFLSLHYLNCDSNAINTISKLPNSLTYLDCSYNQLTSLPALPNLLDTLFCENNQLINLPTLPNSLLALNCNRNQLTTLPILSNSIQTLTCFHNQLTVLPVLPSSLQNLYCGHNQLTSVPTLSNSLINLGCDNNQLANLPTLPNTLSLLYCDSNQITSLPTLPNSLVNLYCKSNQLTSLPALPSGLQNLDCSYNQLTSLSTIPSQIRTLACNNNNIVCFPPFPTDDIPVSSGGPPITNFYFLDISSNPFTCLPNYIALMGSDTVTYPLCAAGNTNGCAVAGIKQVTNNNYQVSVYPNPNNGNFTVEINTTGKQTLQIVDVTGKIVLTQNINDKTNIDASNLDSGMYFIQVKPNENICTQKIIVQH